MNQINRKSICSLLQLSAARIKREFSGWNKEGNNRKKVHAIRVELKKVHVLTKMGNRHQRKAYDRFCRPAFRKLGKLRKLQVMNSQLGKKELPKKISSLLRQERKRSSSALNKKLNMLEENIGSGLDKIMKTATDTNIQQFMDAQAILVRSMKKNSCNAERAHPWRKEIKTLVVAASFFPELSTLRGQKALELAERSLGHWHDMHELRTFLYKNGMGKEPLYRSILKKEKEDLLRICRAPVWKSGTAFTFSAVRR